MIDLDHADNDIERLALSLFKAMEQGDFMDVMAKRCADDFVWANSGLPTLAGQPAIRAHSSAGGFASKVPILTNMRSFSADLVAIASTGDMRGGIVFNERIDHHWDRDGRDLMTPHICGVVEIRDDKATALRDFYDTACYAQEPTEPNPAHAMH
ncbi:MAG: limonene-1,2-epoxide hydrolase family protein [Microthrixaceae bacterium]